MCNLNFYLATLNANSSIVQKPTLRSILNRLHTVKMYHFCALFFYVILIFTFCYNTIISSNIFMPIWFLIRR